MDFASLTSIFNGAGAALVPVAVGGVALVGGFVAWKIAGPDQVKPSANEAKVITGIKLTPLPKQGRHVATVPTWYLQFGSVVQTVNLGSMSVKIERKGADALVTKDKNKAEVEAVFYVEVNDESEEDIIKALRSLGTVDNKTVDSFLSAKFDAALRAAASKMDFDGIHQDREGFIDAVKQSLELKSNGLKLTEASLTSFKQAPIDAFDEKNVQDAEGLKRITQIIEESRQMRNQTVQDAEVKIAEQNKKASIQKFQTEQERRDAELQKDKTIKTLEAQQTLDIATKQAETEKLANLAKTKAEQETEEARIAKQNAVDLAEIARKQAAELKQVEADKLKAEAERNKEIALEQQAQLAAAAKAKTNLAQAEAVKAEQTKITVEETAKAERTKQVSVIKAQETAETAAVKEKTAADATVYVATKQAEATKTATDAAAYKTNTETEVNASATERKAQADAAATLAQLRALADGKLLDADATKAQLLAQAEGQRKINEAQNALDQNARDHLENLERIKTTPSLVEKMAQAMANIKDFTVTSFQGGLPGGNGGGNGAGGSSTGGNVIEQAVAAASGFMVNKPLLEKLAAALGGDVKTAGLIPDLSSLTETTKPTAPAAPVETPPAANENTAPTADKKKLGGYNPE